MNRNLLALITRQRVVTEHGDNPKVMRSLAEKTDEDVIDDARIELGGESLTRRGWRPTISKPEWRKLVHSADSWNELTDICNHLTREKSALAARMLAEGYSPRREDLL